MKAFSCQCRLVEPELRPHPINGDVAEAPAVSCRSKASAPRPRCTPRTTTAASASPNPGGARLADRQNGQHRNALEFVFEWIRRHSPGIDIVAAGHRIVHGGDHYSGPVMLDPRRRRHPRDADPAGAAAPAAQPAGDQVRFTLMPEVRQVGCFDTSFHRTRHPVRGALPAAPRAVRRGREALRLPRPVLRLRGAPAARPAGRRESPRRTSSSPTWATAPACAPCGRPIPGHQHGLHRGRRLMMGTRTGSLDPGVILDLIEQKGMDAKALSNLLYKQSGLLGVSGISQDMRALLASDAAEAAKEAVDLFCYRARRMIGQLAHGRGAGSRRRVFTGGIGEHAAAVRDRRMARLAVGGWHSTPWRQRATRYPHPQPTASKVEVAGGADQRSSG